MKIADLKAEFPKDAVHWRAQSLTRDGKKAMALAYIDARDVMERLDDVCGPENWQDEYIETPQRRVICRIGILYGDRWVWKSDGAGDTDFEGAKGGISDSFKRAAVKWGIGRYLYAMPTIWVPCETYERDGKLYWKRWAANPWDFVNVPDPIDLSFEKRKHVAINDIRGVVNLEDFARLWASIDPDLKRDDDIFAEKESRKAELSARELHQGAG